MGNGVRERKNGWVDFGFFPSTVDIVWSNFDIDEGLTPEGKGKCIDGLGV